MLDQKVWIIFGLSSGVVLGVFWLAWTITGKIERAIKRPLPRKYYRL